MDLSSLNSLTPLTDAGDIILLVVRIIFGTTFIYYGRHKIKNLKSNAADFEKMGFKPGWLWGTPVALLESFGALAIVLGLFTGIVAIAFVIHMATGAIWKILKTDKPFTDWSYDLLALSVALMLAVTGPGSLAVMYTSITASLDQRIIPITISVLSTVSR